MQEQIWNTDTGGTIRQRFDFDTAGHFNANVVTLPTLTGCGTGATVVGTDLSGTVTEGTGATGCTITFATSYATTYNAPAPHCTVTGESGLLTYSLSTTAITVLNVGPLSGTNIDYTCTGG
jgi:hypothetical protein